MILDARGMGQQGSCPACGAYNADMIEDWRGSDGRWYAIHRCEPCGVEFTQGEDDPEQYIEAYRNPLNPLNRQTGRRYFMEREGAETVSSYAQYLLRWVVRNLPRGSKVLDYGCGGGALLRALERSGMKAYGVDVAPELVEALRKKGMRVALANGPSEIPEEWCDVRAVLLVEVLEHFIDPVSFLQKLHERLPHAIVGATVPHPRRWRLGCMGRLQGDYPPNHFVRWTARGMRTAFRRAGYSRAGVFELTPFPTDINPKILPYGAGDWVRRLSFSKRVLGMLMAPLSVWLRSRGFFAESLIGVASR